jgi:hypothetical protein
MAKNGLDLLKKMPVTSKSIHQPSIEFNKKYLDFIHLTFFLISLLQNSVKLSPSPRPGKPEIILVKPGIRVHPTGFPSHDRVEDKPSRNGANRFS